MQTRRFNLEGDQVSAHFNLQRKLRKRRHSAAPKASKSLPVKHNLIQIGLHSDVTSPLPIRSLVRRLCYCRRSLPPTLQLEFTYFTTAQFNTTLLRIAYIHTDIIKTIAVTHYIRQAMYVEHNMEARSCNHCCSGKGICTAQPERVFVALCVQQTMCMCHIAICDLPRSTFFRIISQTTIPSNNYHRPKTTGECGMF